MHDSLLSGYNDGLGYRGYNIYKTANYGVQPGGASSGNAVYINSGPQGGQQQQQQKPKGLIRKTVGVVGKGAGLVAGAAALRYGPGISARAIKNKGRIARFARGLSPIHNEERVSGEGVKRTLRKIVDPNPNGHSWLSRWKAARAMKKSPSKPKAPTNPQTSFTD